MRDEEESQEVQEGREHVEVRSDPLVQNCVPLILAEFLNCFHRRLPHSIFPSKVYLEVNERVVYVLLLALEIQAAEISLNVHNSVF